MTRGLVSALALFVSTIAWAGPNEDLIAGCKQGDLAAVEAALGKGASVDATDTDGHAAIEKAIFWPEIVRKLLAAGANVNGGTYPALVSAGNVYAVETMRVLLDAGADPNKPGVIDDASAPIRAMLAAEEAKGKKANRTMIAAYQTALAQAKPGAAMSFLPLRQVVAQTNCVPCLTLLLEKGADPKLVTERGGNLLHVYAAFGMTQAERKKQFADGAPILETRFGMKVPAWYRDVDTAGNGTPEQMLAPLLKLGLSMEARNEQENTPLLEVLGGGVGNKSAVGVALVNAGADVNVTHSKFGKALLIAARTGMVDVVKAMIARGADVNTEARGWDENAMQPVDGLTALVIAAMRDDLPMVQALMALSARSVGGIHGSSYNIKTGCHTTVRGKGAIYFAIENGNAAMTDLLATVGPWSEFTVDQLQRSTTSTQGNLEVTRVSCITDGTYSPSSYAMRLDSPSAAALKAKGL